uniref:Uncharacterized protein n=1 Tax=Avena sativa TaxID=4498 RepID=A0ACD5VWU0_AVESA
MNPPTNPSHSPPPTRPSTPDLHQPPTPTPSQFLQIQFKGADYSAIPEAGIEPSGMMASPPLSPIRPEGSPAAPHNPPVLQAPEIPQLALNMEVMSIARDNLNQQQEIEKGQFALYLKLATTRGAPRIISLSTVQQQFKRSWRANYGEIIQVHQHIFKAVFTSFQATMWIFERQPWLIGPDTMLIELEDPDGEGYIKEQEESLKKIDRPRYTFQYVYVTVRAYGIPSNNRSMELLENIIKLVGTPSEFHQIKDNMLYGHPDYVWGVIKHRVCNPVFDRIKLSLNQGKQSMAYLSYEKIRRICLFCGVMFHTSANCHLRKSIITDRMTKCQDAEQVPFQRYGPWIIDSDKVPLEKGVHASLNFTNFLSNELSIFNKVFDNQENKRGKSKTQSAEQLLKKMEDNRGVGSTMIQSSSRIMDIRRKVNESTVQQGTTRQTLEMQIQKEDM